jgi:hypothetical protein
MNKINLFQFYRMKKKSYFRFKNFFLLGYHSSEYEMLYYGMEEFTIVSKEPAAYKLRTQGPIWRKGVPSKLLVNLYETTQRCVSERSTVQRDGVPSVGPG